MGLTQGLLGGPLAVAGFVVLFAGFWCAVRAPTRGHLPERIAVFPVLLLPSFHAADYKTAVTPLRPLAV
jgi:hypothetical protein